MASCQSRKSYASRTKVVTTPLGLPKIHRSTRRVTQPTRAFVKCQVRLSPFSLVFTLGSSLSRPHLDDVRSRSADPIDFNVIHAGGSRHISQPNVDPSLTVPKSGGIPGSPSSSFKDLTPTNFPPAHESRRRNAEQRAATLRADVLVGEVEPNRVFCTLCKKWVQLRQDSSYCAYPWLQHRGKCLARQWVTSFNPCPFIFLTHVFLPCSLRPLRVF